MPPPPAKRLGRVPPPLPPRLIARPPAPPDTLDGGWDRRLRRGLVAPDRTIDLHGHTLATAHAALDAELARAIADGRAADPARHRPPAARTARDGDERPRGAIRASIGDWLAGSRHAARIAAVRNAHPRHGGAGALYVVLRRRREAGDMLGSRMAACRSNLRVAVQSPSHGLKPRRANALPGDAQCHGL